MIARAAALACLVLALLNAGAKAHEVRPAYLELTERAAGRYQMVWKVPVRSEFRLRLEPRLPPTCSATAAGPGFIAGGASIQRSLVDCPDGLAGQSLEIAGLGSTMTDVLVRIQWLDGTTQTSRLMPDQPSVVVSGSIG